MGTNTIANTRRNNGNSQFRDAIVDLVAIFFIAAKHSEPCGAEEGPAYLKRMQEDKEPRVLVILKPEKIISWGR